jgi:hypothetical protein
MPVFQRQDSTTLEQWDTDLQQYTLTVSGVISVQRPFTDAEVAELAGRVRDAARNTNAGILRQRARAALAADQAYLNAVAAGTITAPQVAAQVASLTQQVQGLIRGLVASDLLDNVDGGQ